MRPIFSIPFAGGRGVISQRLVKAKMGKKVEIDRGCRLTRFVYSFLRGFETGGEEFEVGDHAFSCFVGASDANGAGCGIGYFFALHRTINYS